MNLSPYVALIQLFINMSMPWGYNLGFKKTFICRPLAVHCLPKLQFKDTASF